MIVEGHPVQNRIHALAPCGEFIAMNACRFQPAPEAFRGELSQQLPLRLIDERMHQAFNES